MKTQKKEMLSVRKLVGLSFGFAAALCALEYGKPLLGEREPVGSSEEIAWIEPDELEIRRIKLPDPPKVIEKPKPKPVVQQASIVTSVIDIMKDIRDLPEIDLDFEVGDDLFVTTDSVVLPDIPFDIVEEMPEFPGGEEALFRFLGKEIKYPKFAFDNRIQGTVHLRFIVGKDGYVQEESIEILRSPHESLSRESIDAIKNMPQWKPGMQRGKRVPVYYKLPVKYYVN